VDDESEDDDEEVDVDVDADKRELPDEVGPTARGCIVVIGDWGAGLDEEPRLDEGNQLARLRALVRGILKPDEPSLEVVDVDGMGDGMDDRLVYGWTRRWVGSKDLDRVVAIRVKATVVEQRKGDPVDRVDFDGWLARSTTFCSNLLLAETSWLDRERRLSVDVWCGGW
jgi:hypothetical protein